MDYFYKKENELIEKDIDIFKPFALYNYQPPLANYYTSIANFLFR